MLGSSKTPILQRSGGDASVQVRMLIDWRMYVNPGREAGAGERFGGTVDDAQRPPTCQARARRCVSGIQ
ncbi:hypothetical protein FRACA_3960001 [Frankia canadensis]|uniref:Uncharacterized protein n=1 Tax=Frankia canadensis TaxID=1836972 RepID=A0A2I2KWC0_9ACTN|nr:hypothetical protein FRACA_3960001 [Frankia canadensis]SOU57244.1 hypothetical protein FRACA_3960001 [Frankia canadensis]